MGLVVRVLDQPLLRMGEGDEETRNLQAVDQVVEDGLHARVHQVLGAVVDHEEIVAPRGAKSRRKVEDHAPRSRERLALEDHLLQRPRARIGIRLRPLGDFVAFRRRNRILSEGVGSPPGIQRVQKPFHPPPVDSLELVLDSGCRGELHHQEPEIGALDPVERLRRGKAEDPVAEEQFVGLAAIDERRISALAKGERVVRRRTRRCPAGTAFDPPARESRASARRSVPGLPRAHPLELPIGPEANDARRCPPPLAVEGDAIPLLQNHAGVGLRTDGPSPRPGSDCRDPASCCRRGGPPGRGTSRALAP